MVHTQIHHRFTLCNIFVQFFETFATWDWRNPIGLSSSHMSAYQINKKVWRVYCVACSVGVVCRYCKHVAKRGNKLFVAYHILISNSVQARKITLVQPSSPLSSHSHIALIQKGQSPLTHLHLNSCRRT